MRTTRMTQKRIVVERRLLITIIAALVILPVELFAGGRQNTCEKRFLPPIFDEGDYQFIVVGTNDTGEVREYVKETALDVVRRQEVMFLNTIFDFTETHHPLAAAQLDNAIFEYAKTGKRPVRRAYIVVDDGGTDIATKVPSGNDMIISIPSFDRPDIISMLQTHPLKKAEYIERMSMHATLQALLFWHGDNSIRVSEITFEHMLTEPSDSR